MLHNLFIGDFLAIFLWKNVLRTALYRKCSEASKTSLTYTIHVIHIDEILANAISDRVHPISFSSRLDIIKSYGRQFSLARGGRGNSRRWSKRGYIAPSRQLLADRLIHSI
jgi:hypothetical protein